MSGGKSEEDKKQEEAGRDWPEFLIEHEEVIGKYIDRIAGHIHEEIAEGRKQALHLARAQAKSGRWIIYLVLGIIVTALFMTFILVREGLLSGETFVFFGGALLGSLITFLSERIATLLYMSEWEEPTP